MISKSAAYALRAMAALAGLPEGSFASTEQLAKCCDAPEKYLAKLMSILRENNLVQSQPGLHGGHRLVNPANQISLYDVIEPIDHVSRIPDCLLRCRDCKRTCSCPRCCRQRWNDLVSDYLGFLQGTMLCEILSESEKTKSHESSK